MKTTNLIFIIISIGFFDLSNPVRAISDDDYVKKYYPLLKANESDGTGQMGILFNFFKEIPANSQAEVLARILEKASVANSEDYALVENILGISEGYQDKKVEWNAHLEKLIYAQAKSPNSNVREMVARILAKMRMDDAHDLVLSFLNDPDENVRAKTLDSIAKWPDAESIYQGYIQSHQKEVDHLKSVQYAKDNLSIIRQKSK